MSSGKWDISGQMTVDTSRPVGTPALWVQIVVNDLSLPARSAVLTQLVLFELITVEHLRVVEMGAELPIFGWAINKVNLVKGEF